ncbi:MAG: PAS domain S-box protein [Planctomycetes bacterium]|nr:PAS domain S-box protein [Planctomycetota bacterium]
MDPSALDLLPDPAAVLDPGGSIVLVNAAWRRLAGAGAARAERPESGIRTIEQCLVSHGVPAEKAAAASVGIQAVLDGRIDSFTTENCCRAAGEERLFHMRAAPAPVAGGRGATVLCLDVTGSVDLERRALSQEEELSRRILDAVPSGILFVRADGSIASANGEALRILGVSIEELRSVSILDYAGKTIREDGSPCPVEEYPVYRCLRTGEPQPPMTIGGLRPDGQVFWGIYTAIPFTGSGGAVLSPPGPPERMCSLPPRSGAPPEGAVGAVPERGTKLKGSVPTTSGEVLSPPKECAPSRLGREHPPEGASEGAIVAFVDITPRKRAEQELRKSEERFRELAESIREVFYVASSDYSKIHYVSPAYEETWGRTCASLYESPMSWFEAIHPEDKARIATVLEANVDKGVTYSAEYRVVRPDGSVRWVWDRAYELRGRGGPSDRVVGVAEDITARKSLEEQLRQSQKLEAIGRLAGGVAHDFNNLLTVILGYSDSLMKDLSPDDPVYRALGDIRKAGERTALVTRQLLAFSQRQVLAPVRLDLNAFLLDTEDMLRRLVGERVYLRIATQPGLWPVRADPGPMLQVVVNLVVNARDAMPAGGILEIETRNVEREGRPPETGSQAPAGPHVLLSVKDTGRGMDPETRAHLFEPFFTTKERGEGTGLGLATVYGVVTQSGGAIAVHSEPGRGTRFDVYLPRSSEVEEASGPVPPLPAGPSGGETLLVVEDESTVRAMLRDLLEARGYCVLEASDGQEALSVAQKLDGPLHILVTDLLLPGMTGRELAARLRRQRFGIKVLYMSGYGGDAVRPELSSPDAAFIQKPFTPESLAIKVRDVLERR